MKKPFTPEEVAAKYKEHDARPATAMFGVWSNRGEVVRLMDDEGRRCCALSVMLLGEPIPEDTDDPSIFALIRSKWPELHGWSFIDGFDGNNETSSKACEPDWDKDSYDLGLEVRTFLKKEFPGLW